MGLSTSLGDQSRWAGAQNFYGNADLDRDLAAGVSHAQIKANMAANGGQFRSQETINRINNLSGSSGGGGGGGSSWAGGSVGTGAGGFKPGDINFNPGGVDMGGDSGDSWSNEDFIRGLAKERAEAFSEGQSNQSNSITNNIEQNIGNKGDWETNIGDNNTIMNSEIGNDYSLNLGSINVANRQNGFAA